VICGRRVRVEKVKREPLRCLKCQGWNHHTRDCPSPTDKCGNCAEDHQTDHCPPHHLPFCVSCDSLGHASWSRLCPMYRKKVTECNTWNPENALQFFPTTEPWTWSNSETTKEDPPSPCQRNTHHSNQERDKTDTYHPIHRDNSYRPTKGGNKYWPSQKVDTYCPSQRTDSYHPTDTYRPIQWGAAGPIVDWSDPPWGWNNDLPPSRSWDDETLQTNDRRTQQAPTTTTTTAAPVNEDAPTSPPSSI